MKQIQCRLFEIGSHIATPRNASDVQKQSLTEFEQQHIDDLEKDIDWMDSQLPKLKNFILPGGGLASAHIHVC